MIFEILAWAGLVMSGIPAGLFLLNLMVYQRLSKEKSSGPLSVLIPVRNEEQNIKATLESVLSNRDLDLEVIVLNDHSTDRTAEIVTQMAKHDNRLRMENAPPLPSGWCGKQHACYRLSQLANHSWMLFMDADVRLAPDALPRLVAWTCRNDLDLASGVPRQLLGSFSERLLIPLIHFILLGFLPMHLMRWTNWPGFSAGCGQLFLVRRDAYQRCGGHSQIKASLHDGITLPRVFRKAGFCTGLFDATDLAACRMYTSNGQVWRGLGKNAVEGLAAPANIIPVSILLIGGQVIPFILLAMAPLLSRPAILLAVVSVGLSYFFRVLAAIRFYHPIRYATIQPFAILALLTIQWHALTRYILGQPSEWKGRIYSTDSIMKRKSNGFISPLPQKLQWLRKILMPLLTALRIRPRESRAELREQKSISMFHWSVVLILGMIIGGLISISAAEAPSKSHQILSSFELKDQHGTLHSVSFPRTNLMILTVADRMGSAQVKSWIVPLKQKYGQRIALMGVADLSEVPRWFRGLAQSKFRKLWDHPIMLDWEGTITHKLGGIKDQMILYVVNKQGVIVWNGSGVATEDTLNSLLNRIDQSL